MTIQKKKFGKTQKGKDLYRQPFHIKEGGKLITQVRWIEDRASMLSMPEVAISYSGRPFIQNNLKDMLILSKSASRLLFVYVKVLLNHNDISFIISFKIQNSARITGMWAKDAHAKGIHSHKNLKNTGLRPSWISWLVQPFDILKSHRGSIIAFSFTIIIYFYE